jgi:predicted DNA-binding transcriptional regulator YafY
MRATARQNVAKTESDVRKAVKLGLPVTIDYVKGDGSPSLRTIEPHEVRETGDGSLIVIAMCRMKGDRRHFRLDRITHYTLHRGTFQLEMPGENDPTDWWAFTSRTGVEVFRTEVVIPAEVPYSEWYEYTLSQAHKRSAKLRAVVKAEHGVGMRRLRRGELRATV